MAASVREAVSVIDQMRDGRRKHVAVLATR